MKERTRQYLISALKSDAEDGGNRFQTIAFARCLADGVVHGKRDCYALAASLRAGKAGRKGKW